MNCSCSAALELLSFGALIEAFSGRARPETDLAAVECWSGGSEGGASTDSERSSRAVVRWRLPAPRNTSPLKSFTQYFLKKLALDRRCSALNVRPFP